MTSTTPIPMERLDVIVKAYDVRGTVPDQMDAEMCRGLGAAFARFVGTDKIIVARDMRPDGVEFAARQREDVPAPALGDVVVAVKQDGVACVPIIGLEERLHEISRTADGLRFDS